MARVLGAVGRTLIGLGIVILLFAAYQLWGTNLQEARAQNQLDDEFTALLEQAGSIGVADSSTAPTTTAAPGASTTPTTTAAPGASTTTVPSGRATNPQRFTPEQLAFFFPEGGDAVARIEIPGIGVDKVVVEGVAVSDLRKGPGHYRATPLPGQPGNSAIAGHRTTYGAPFGDIDRLEADDEILVTTVQGTFRYRVMAAGAAFPDAGLEFERAVAGHLIVRPSDTWVLSDFGDNRLTLTACHPKYSARQRIVVAAELLETPAVAVPRPAELDEGETLEYEDPDSGELVAVTGGAELAEAEANEVSLDEGLGWDRAALPDAILWALLCLAVIALAQVGAHRWRRWPSYALAAVPLAVFMWLMFVQVDRLLPAY